MTDRTLEAVTKQIQAMGCEVFEVGLFNPMANANEPVMIPRTWDNDTASLRSVVSTRIGADGTSWMSEHRLSLIDDLAADDIQNMKTSVPPPACCADIAGQLSGVGQTPGSPRQRNEHRSGAGAGAQRFGGDPGAADRRHFGRFRAIRIGRTNTRAATACIRLSASWKAAEPSTSRAGNSSRRFVRSSRKTAQNEHDIRSGALPRSVSAGPLKGIDEFRAMLYGGDGTRVDLACGLCAFLMVLLRRTSLLHYIRGT